MVFKGENGADDPAYPFILSMQPDPASLDDLKQNLNTLVEAVVEAVVQAHQSQIPEHALVIRDELRRLPDAFVTEVLNSILLRLVAIDPTLCRWFVLDVFLRDADPEGKADVAERINLLIADLAE